MAHAWHICGTHGTFVAHFFTKYCSFWTYFVDLFKIQKPRKP